MSLPRALEPTVRNARSALSQGRPGDAVALLRPALLEHALADRDLVTLLDSLREALVAYGRIDGALAIDGFLEDRTRAATVFDRASQVARGRTLEAWGRRAAEAGDQAEAERCHSASAEAYLASGCPARAAIAYERARRHADARAQWERVARELEHDRRPDDPETLYALGLARYDVARACKALDAKSDERRALVAAVNALELAADQFERTARRERAFDCYEVLIALGTKSGEFEHALEGYVNATRVLREDGLKRYALQHYERAIAHAEAAGELAAAASLAAELRDYGRLLERPEVVARASLQEAELWEQVGRAVLARGGPATVVENAWLAAIVAHAESQRHARAERLYRQLAELDLEESRRRHHARAAERLRHAGDTSTPVVAPAASGDDGLAYPDVWHDDLVEREQQGSVAAACLDLVHDRQGWSTATRLRALSAYLIATELEAARRREAGAVDDAAVAPLVRELASLSVYPLLAPLEALFRSGGAQTRVAVLTALQRFLFKRTFVTVRLGLDDERDVVRTQARTTLEALTFSHALDSLARIYRESSEQATRLSALRALGSIDEPASAELLLGVFRHGGSDERGAALAGLRRGRGSAFKALVQPLVDELPREARDPLRDLFAGR